MVSRGVRYGKAGTVAGRAARAYVGSFADSFARTIRSLRHQAQPDAEPMTGELARISAELKDRYRIDGVLGAGGMATVYLAHDVKHERRVAIKVLRPELAAIIGGERFLAEIRTTAHLQHPNILPLFDSGEADSFLYYVMPYLEGESLRDRLNRETQLPIPDAVRIAAEVASALDYAHRRGVIHRDVKPENVLFHDGRALVADFGIALAASNAGGGRMTATGMSLGTPQYMSPEQAMGDRVITARSDVYALGAMTYEMLVGEPPFTGPSAQAIVGKVLSAEPVPPREVRKSIPEHVQDAVLTALQKLPADRFATAGAFAESLGGTGTPPPATRAGRKDRAPEHAVAGAVAAWHSGRRSLLVGAPLLMLLAAAAGWQLNSATRQAVSGAPVRMAFSLAVPGVDRSHLEISPDGRRIIQVVSDSNGVDRVVMRELGSTELVAIAGSEGAVDPVFSLDGDWISFNAEGKLRKVPVRGGPAIDVADSASVGGGAWTPDGSIIYTRDGRGLWSIPSAGGQPRQLTSLDTARKEFNHWYPQMLPAGNAVIYTSYATPIARASIEAFDLSTRRRKVLVEGAVYGRYTSGFLLYARGGTIFAVPFDPDALKVLGTPVPVQQDVAWVATDGLAGYAVASSGTLAFLKASEWNVDRRVVWADRAGREQPALPAPGPFAEPRLSPDGRWIVVTVTEPRRELWLYEVGRGVLTPLSRTDNVAFDAIWSPDSRSVVYAHEDPVYDLHRIPIDGSAPNEPVVTSRWDKFPTAISPDGRSIAYVENNNSDRIIIAQLDGTGKPRALTSAGVSERSAAFSPDGRWIAYEELAHGQPDVYLVAADGRAGRRQVSVEGGEQPRWSRGGRELVFRRGSAMMGVTLEPATGDVGKPVELFRKGQPDRLGGGRTLAYDVSADGERFLLVVPQQKWGAQPTVVVLNWVEELKARSGTASGRK
jgi:eukaryotic-like serine/threonine-protein kinase